MPQMKRMSHPLGKFIILVIAFYIIQSIVVLLLHKNTQAEISKVALALQIN